jgi:hypothetical protein
LEVKATADPHVTDLRGCSRILRSREVRNGGRGTRSGCEEIEKFS